MSGVVVPVRPKATSTAAKVPATTDIVLGELGVNLVDGKGWWNYTPGGGAQTIMQLWGAGTAYSGVTLDNSIIGGTTPAAGSFTTGTFSSTLTLSGLTATTLLGLDGSKHAVSLTLANGLSLSGTTLSVVAASVIPAAPAAKTSAYTLLQTDNNTTIVVNSASTVAITAPSLTAGTAITIAQRGAGKVTITASGTTLTWYPSGSTGTAGAGAQMTLYWDTSTTILIGGAVS